MTSILILNQSFFSGPDVTPNVAAYLSTLFDVGGIAGGIAAGLISDTTGKSASTCAVMLVAAIPSVSSQQIETSKSGTVSQIRSPRLSQILCLAFLSTNNTRSFRI